ncbi:MGF-110-8L [African swine fever virus]|nr:MGF_110-8L [African swine fever virus]WAS30455.1 MGF-110-8L [African swine fever virus]
MKVLILVLLGVVILQAAPIRKLEDLLPTRYPPKHELVYWCTYANQCDFCWECVHGICRNRIQADWPVIHQNDWIINCTVSRWLNKCMYDLGQGIDHVMVCSQPKHWNPYKILKKEWKENNSQNI